MQSQHPSGIRQDIVDKVTARRGRLHAFEYIDPAKTALVVIDLDMGTGRNDAQKTASVARNVCELAQVVRQLGGTVVWVTTPIQRATANFRAVFGDELTKKYESDGQSGKSKTLWPELMVDAADVHATKTGHSAFFPGKSELHDQLQQKGIEYVMIAGAVTNVCCEASARDAAELQYKVTLISDAFIGWSDEQDQAAFATFYRCYGDVRPTNDTVQLLKNKESSLRRGY